MRYLVRPQRARRRHFAFASLGLAVGSMALLCQMLGTSVSSATTSAKSTSLKVKPDRAFFRGKTITAYIGAAPGNAFSEMAQAIQVPLEQYLGATINYIYAPAGANVNISIDTIGHAVPDGLTIGMANLVSIIGDIYANQNTNFPIRTASFIGSSLFTPTILVACTGSPFTTFDQLLKTTTPFTFVNEVSGGVALESRLLMSVFNVPHRYLLGYTGSTLGPGCMRGDGQVALSSAGSWVNAAGTAFAPGITPLLLLGPEPKGSAVAFLNKEVPTLASYTAKHPPKSPAAKVALKLTLTVVSSTSPEYLLFGPKGIPQKRLLVLQNAMASVMKQATIKTTLSNLGITPGFASAAIVRNALDLAIKRETIAQRFLNT